MTRFALLLVAFGGFIALSNWWSVFWSYHTKRFHSAVPLVGAAFLGMGMFILSATRWYCWTALILDYGTFALLLSSPRIFHEIWATSRFNLLSEYVGQSGMKTARIRLFRKKVFTIRLEVNRRSGNFGIAGRGTIGEWERDGKHLRLTVGQESAIFTEARCAAFQQSSGFPSWENNQDTSLANMRFIQTKGGAK